MAARVSPRNVTFVLMVLVVAVLSTGDAGVITSCTTITIEPSVPPSTLITMTSPSREMSSEAPTTEPESTESEPPYTAESGPDSEEPESPESEPSYTTESGPDSEEPEPSESEPSYTAESDPDSEEPQSTESEPPCTTQSDQDGKKPPSTESERPYTTQSDQNSEGPQSSKSEPPHTTELSRGGRPMAGPHYITRSIPFPQLPSAAPHPATQQPASQQPGAQRPGPQTPYQPAPTADKQPPSTTWRYDPVVQPNPTARPCNELNEMAFAKYKYTMELCRKAAKGGPEEGKRLIIKLGGYNFLPFCKISPPVECCVDVQETINARRCFTWWPSPDSPSYYEPPAGIVGRMGS